MSLKNHSFALDLRFLSQRFSPMPNTPITTSIMMKSMSDKPKLFTVASSPSNNTVTSVKAQRKTKLSTNSHNSFFSISIG